MAAGEPPVYDPNKYYRILESDDGHFYPQHKGIFKWKNYDHGQKYDFVVAKFGSYPEALEFLNKKIDEEETRRTRFKGKKYIVHRPFRQH